MVRASPLSPEERRTALVDATVPLLTRYGRAVTTKQIAEAAGVAEGTIFRVFGSKDELVDAAITQAFQAGHVVEDILAIPRDLDLRERAVRMVSLLQERFREMFALMEAVGMVGPPDRLHTEQHERRVRASLDAMVHVLGPEADAFALPAERLVHVLRMLVFAGTHPKLSGGETLTPEQIVDTVLYGVVPREDT